VFNKDSKVWIFVDKIKNYSFIKLIASTYDDRQIMI